MQKDNNHLTMNSPEVKGNNPYILNRMTIDSSFKTPHGNINSIIGYGANGNIISDKDQHNPFNSKISNSGFDNAKKPSAELMSANTRQQSWSFLDKDLKANIDEIKALTSNGVKKHKRNNTIDSSWRTAFKPASVQGEQHSLHKITEDRYNAILHEKTN